MSKSDTVVLDVWGGPSSTEHLARFIRPRHEALQIADRELAAGFLVNLRQETAWGTSQEFDERKVN